MQLIFVSTCIEQSTERRANTYDKGQAGLEMKQTAVRGSDDNGEWWSGSGMRFLSEIMAEEPQQSQSC